MSITEDDYETILKNLDQAVRNKHMIHSQDEEKVEKIFCDLLAKNMEYTVNNVQQIIRRLNSEYSQFTRNMILEIALYKKRLHFKQQHD
jgi:hypothetical protein